MRRSWPGIVTANPRRRADNVARQRTQTAFASPTGSTAVARESDDRTVIDLSDPRAPTVLQQWGSQLFGSHSYVEINPRGDAVVVVGYAPPGWMSPGDIATSSVYLIDDRWRLQAVGQPLADRKDQGQRVAWSPDGSLLWMRLASGTDSLWDLSDPASAQPLVALSPRTAERLLAAWSHDGRTVALTGWNGAMALVHLDRLVDLLANARSIGCRAAGGEMSEAEWARYAAGVRQHPRACP